MAKQKKHYFLSLKSIIIASVITVCLIIGIILSVISAYTYSVNSRSNMMIAVSQNLNLITDNLDGNVRELSRIIRLFQNNSSVLHFAENSSSDSFSSLKAFDRVYEEYRNSSISPYINRLIIGNQYQKYIQIVEPVYSVSADIDGITRSLPQFQSPCSPSSLDFSYGIISDPYLLKEAPGILILNEITGKYNTACGYICTFINTDFFTESLKYYAPEKGSHLYLTLGDHTYLFDQNRLIPIKRNTIEAKAYEKISFPSSASASTWKDSSSGQSGYAVTIGLKAEGCYITQTISEAKLSELRSFLIVMILIILISTLAIGVLFSLLLYRLINVPVLRLTDRLEKISEGDFSKDSSIEWQNELGDIGCGINSLSQKIDVLLKERVAAEKGRNELEYQVLQSQIQPHFIYNTLNSIRLMAMMQGADGIAEMTTAFSKLLRNIAKGTQNMIPLSEELDLLQDYFTIEQYRYGQSLHLTIQVDENDLLSCLIPKFTLQPIVENSIFHGIEPKGLCGTISIHISHIDENSFRIEIHDDGIGMSEETIQSVLSSSKSENKTQFFRQIGVGSVRQRLEYEFGSPFGLTMESRLSEGTTTILTLPCCTTIKGE